MFNIRGFWGRHKRKILVGLGVVGGSYVVYRLWDSHQRRMLGLNRRKEMERQEKELMKIQLKNHFESIQRISDITTLPYAMHELRARILEQLDLSELRDRLMRGKGQPGMLSAQERIELWGRLKILSKPTTLFSCYFEVTAMPSHGKQPPPPPICHNSIIAHYRKIFYLHRFSKKICHSLKAL